MKFSYFNIYYNALTYAILVMNDEIIKLLVEHPGIDINCRLILILIFFIKKQFDKSFLFMEFFNLLNYNIV